eukprot:scaffold227285_cov15-Tisochrysis_lutea.AAC.1
MHHTDEGSLFTLLLAEQSIRPSTPSGLALSGINLPIFFQRVLTWPLGGDLSQEPFLSLPGPTPPKVFMQLCSMIAKTQHCIRSYIGSVSVLECSNGEKGALR